MGVGTSENAGDSVLAGFAGADADNERTVCLAHRVRLPARCRHCFLHGSTSLYNYLWSIAEVSTSRYYLGMTWNGKRFRELREDNGQSQGDIAHALAVWPNTVSRWELDKARPSGRYLRQLGKMYPEVADWVQAA